jgi:hypothetical protein
LGLRIRTPPLKKYFYGTSGKNQRKPKATEVCRADDNDEDTIPYLDL